ncbi:hypothetical protein F4859DRAFT_198032 [Xylaria cf. heliscus]|nr:hypothetical protein F4859DRAFT_198032 [Xylaria cf. heliscus]
MYFPNFRLEERQTSRAPCPNGNGTTIGTEQQFVVYCDTRFRGDEIFRQKADSLSACTDMCTSFQNPRCEGAQFRENKDCVLLGNIVPEGTRPSRIFDSALAVFPQPGPTSSCLQQGTGTTFLSRGSSFTLQCGKVVNGNDLEQQFQMTLESCLAACSANPACGGVTFDPQQTAGFRNCYLKTTIDDSDTFAKTGLDSAVIVNNANQAVNSNIPAAGTSTSTSTSASVISSTPSEAVPQQPTAFITIVPSQGAASGAIVTVSVPVPVTSVSSAGALADSTPGASSGAATDNSRGGINSDRPRFGNVGPSTSSNAWIAAPVIGGIAALTLVLTVFVLWGRRRRRRDNNNTDSPLVRNGRADPTTMSMALGNFGKGLGDAAADRLSRSRAFFSSSSEKKTRLGSSSSSDLDDDKTSRYANRGGFKVVSGSGRRIGLNGQEIPGTGPGLGGMIVTAGRGRVVSVHAGSARSSSPTSSAGLRDSQNGLRQNRLTGNWLDAQPGIPAEFRGPDSK